MAKAELTNKDIEAQDKLDALTVELSTMSKAKKLALMDGLLLDTYITTLFTGQLKANDLGAVVTYLKNNKEIAEKKEHSEADLIDELVEE